MAAGWPAISTGCIRSAGIARAISTPAKWTPESACKNSSATAPIAARERARPSSAARQRKGNKGAANNVLGQSRVIGGFASTARSLELQRALDANFRCRIEEASARLIGRKRHVDAQFLQQDVLRRSKCRERVEQSKPGIA